MLVGEEGDDWVEGASAVLVRGRFGSAGEPVDWWDWWNESVGWGLVLPDRDALSESFHRHYPKNGG